MFKRIFFFALVNILVMVTLSISLNLLGVGRYLTPYGISYPDLMAFCLVWGMGGAFISLLLSRPMAKWSTGARVIDPQAAVGAERELVSMVHQLAKGAALPAMPQVAVYDSPEVNAFATGATKSRGLVAVSTGLLNRMDRGAVEGVLGHEVAHIANGDMVTMTLIQGVVNAFAMFLARIAGFFASQGVREEQQYMVRTVVTIVAEIVLTILGTLVVAYFSRMREFRADSGGARLAGRPKMIAALEALRSTTQLVDAGDPALATLKMAGRPNRVLSLFSTHPSLDVRIERLRAMS